MTSPSAPHVELSNSGPIIHFSHANGYPPLAYRAMLSPFESSHKVIASLHRPLWPQFEEPNSLHSWKQLGEDVQSLLAEENRPVISIGHSMGSAAILMRRFKSRNTFER